MKGKIIKIYRVKNIVFFATLGTLAVIGALWFLRPHVSEIEKRELAEFPKLTWAGLVDGSFASGVDEWYSDSYPLRELFISGSHRLQTLYGNRSEQIIIKDDQADAIPDVPAETGSPSGAAPSPEATPNVTPELTQNAASESPSETALIGTASPVPDQDSDATQLPGGNTGSEGEVLGSLYVSGDSAYDLYYFKQSAAEQYAELMARTYRSLGGKAQVYSLIVPLSSGVILDQSLISGFGASDQRAAIEYINSRMGSEVHALNVFDTMKQHSSEYIYFRTDHHWTALGAYYAYTEFCREKGIAPHTTDQFEQRSYTGFLGTFYSETQSAAMRNNPDTVTAYVPMGTNSMMFVDSEGKETNWSIITNVDGYKSGGKYYCFVGADQPYSYAHNPQITDGSSCVVIKDSFGNAFIPFLIDHYEHIYWIDFRYYKGTLPDLVREKGIDDVIYCLSIHNSCNSGAFKYFDRLVP